MVLALLAHGPEAGRLLPSALFDQLRLGSSRVGGRGGASQAWIAASQREHVVLSQAHGSLEGLQDEEVLAGALTWLGVSRYEGRESPAEGPPEHSLEQQY